MKIRDYFIQSNSSGIDLKLLSIIENQDSNENDGQIVYQKPDTLSIHKPDKKWLLISSDVGYFNKFTHFTCGDIASILFINTNGELCYPTITEVSKNPQKYFMLYPLPYNMFEECQNSEMEFIWESKRFNRTKKEKTIVKLDFELGLSIGKKFFYYDENYSSGLTKFEEAINGSNDNKLFWPNKSLIINSNPEFVLGILFGYLETSTEVFSNKEESIKETLFINKTNNSYVFSTLLNWLGASYSFQNIQLIKNDNYQTQMRMHITLPHSLLGIFKIILKSYPQYDEFRKIFKSHEWFLTTKNKVRKMPIGAKEKSKSNYNTLIDTGKLRIVPMSSFKFNAIKTDLEMYDFSMPRADATNYTPAFCPILKNSDGDILTMSAIYGKEAIEDAKAFEPTHKEWFRNLNDGAINNYIADDAILGLYAATKFLG